MEVMKGKVTSFDIAYKAGVSQSTVSRAMSGSPLVSEETRQHILQIAREMNYTVDKSASNLRKQYSATLAVLIFEDPTIDDSLINPFFLTLLGSIIKAGASHNYDVLMSFQNADTDWHAVYQESNKADGLLLLGYGDFVSSRTILERLEESGTRFVRWGDASSDAPGISIGSDNRQGGFDATKHLISSGRSRIAFLGDASEHRPEFRARYQGYRDALDANGVEFDPELHVSIADSLEELGERATLALLDHDASFDAVFAASDLLAIGAMHALQSRDLRVPEDVAVIGFDDIALARSTTPPLTTVRQNTKLAGTMMVDTLVALLLNDKEASSQLLPSELVVRGSA